MVLVSSFVSTNREVVLIMELISISDIILAVEVAWVSGLVDFLELTPPSFLFFLLPLFLFLPDLLDFRRRFVLFGDKAEDLEEFEE